MALPGISVVDPSAEDLHTIVGTAQKLRWIRLSALIVVLWDHIICLDKEVEFVWKRPWTRFTIIYTIIRYGQVVALTFYVWGRPKVHFKRQIGSYQMQDFSIRSHRTYSVGGFNKLSSRSWTAPAGIFWAMFEGYSGSFSTVLFQSVLAARVWVLYGNSKSMFYILAVALSASLAGMLTVWALHTPIALSCTAKVGDIDFYVCHETRAAPYIWLFWLSPLAYDTLVCFLAIYKGYISYQAKLGSKMYLMRSIVRDSVFYFIAISIIELTVMVMWLLSGGKGIIMKAPIIFAGVIPLILCCHLILNLRESYHQPLTVTTTQGGEISEWGSRLPESHIGRGLDSMGLPKLSMITSVANDA